MLREAAHLTTVERTLQHLTASAAAVVQLQASTQVGHVTSARLTPVERTFQHFIASTAAVIVLQAGTRDFATNIPADAGNAAQNTSVPHERIVVQRPRRRDV